MSRAWECRRRLSVSNFGILLLHLLHCTFQDMEDPTYPLSCFGSDNGSQARSFESSCVSDRSFVGWLRYLRLVLAGKFMQILGSDVRPVRPLTGPRCWLWGNWQMPKILELQAVLKADIRTEMLNLWGSETEPSHGAQHSSQNSMCRASHDVIDVWYISHTWYVWHWHSLALWNLVKLGLQLKQPLGSPIRRRSCSASACWKHMETLWPWKRKDIKIIQNHQILTISKWFPGNIFADASLGRQRSGRFTS